MAVTKTGSTALALCEVLVYAEDKRLPMEVNMALGKPVWQVTNESALGLPRKSVDGNTDSTYSKGFCSTTSTGSDRWWMVNLLKSVAITRVRIHNRLDCCCKPTCCCAADFLSYSC